MRRALRACLAAAIFLGPAAQATAMERTILQRVDTDPQQEVVFGVIEIKPGESTGRRTHPGAELVLVTEGALSVDLAGQPQRIVGAGESILFPRGAPHDARNAGATPVKAVVVWVVDKGKPMSEPAP